MTQYYLIIHPALPIITMYKNKKILIILLVLFGWITSISAQSSTSTKMKVKRNYTLILYAGSGLAQYVANINTQPIGLQTNIKKINLYETIRVMWHPKYRLSVGLETGYTNFYSYTLSNAGTVGKVKLTAVPLLVVVSVKIVKRVNIFAGFGSYFLTTHLNYNGQLTSHAQSLGSNFAINYVQPITKKLGLAVEAKFVDAFQTKDYMLAAQLQLVWRFLDY